MDMGMESAIQYELGSTKNSPVQNSTGSAQCDLVSCQCSKQSNNKFPTTQIWCYIRPGSWAFFVQIVITKMALRDFGKKTMLVDTN
ncbi:hypothetical protein CR513_46840, partial [Mucuna pruriens]